MFHYQFLTLDILYLIPALLLLIYRKDLMRYALPLLLMAIPFAFTEPLFYPTYWEPNFLFEMGRKFHWGLEDILFVLELAFIAVVLYPALFQLTVSKPEFSIRQQLLQLIPIAIISLTVVLWAIVYTIPAIWFAPILMVFATIWILFKRKDMIKAALMGATLNTVLYVVICKLLELFIPHVFENVWHAQNFSNIYLFHIPLEEYTYIATVGAIATVFLPYLQKRTFIPLEQQ